METNIQKNSTYYQVGFVIIITILAFLPALKADFVYWDDDQYILNNPTLLQFTVENIKKIFSSFLMGNYHPFTMITYLIEVTIFGFNPFVFHFNNLVIHVINSVILYYVLLKLFKNQNLAFFVSLLFGIHPMHIESVTWIAERKDVLYTFFYLLTINFYINYVENKKSEDLQISILFFIASCLSKAMAVSLFPVLFLIDFYKSGTLVDKKLMASKVLFVSISLVLGVVAIFAQKDSGSIRTPMENYQWFDSLFIASYGILFYPIKSIVTYPLANFYFYPEKTTALLPFVYLLSFPLVLVCTYLVYYFYKLTNNKIILFGAFFYLFNIALVLQVLPVGNAIVAERYFYVSSIGIFILFGLLFENVLSKIKGLKFSNFVYLIALPLLFITYNRNKVWANTVTLFTDLTNQNPKQAFPYNTLGYYYYQNNDFASAKPFFEKTLQLDSTYEGAYSNLGNIYLKQNDLITANNYYRMGLKVKSDFADLYNGLGYSFLLSKQYDSSIVYLAKAVELNDKNFITFNNLGMAYYNNANINEAEVIFNKSIQNFPLNSAAYFYLGNINTYRKDFVKAEQNYIKALQVDPNQPEVLNSLGYVYGINNKPNDALSCYQKAIELSPNNALYFNNLAELFYNLKKYNEAKTYFIKAIELNSINSYAMVKLGTIELINKDFKKSNEYYTMAINCDNDYADAYNGAGYTAIELKDYNSAKLNLLKADSLNPNNALFIANIGYLYEKLGNKKLAINYYTQSKSLGNTAIQSKIDALK